MIKLDILSDPICPWCLIGKTRLDQVLQDRPDHPFTIEWHPFQLNPDMPPEGMDRRDYLETKFGGREGAVKAYAPVVEAAEATGLDIAFDRIERTPNTLDAHRMIHWAGLEGRQAAMVAALFNAYFMQGRDIGDHDTLLALAGDVGMDREMTARLLDSDADRADIAARDAHARARGVTGVPTFIIAERHAVPGAQPPELWHNVLDDLERQAAEAEADAE
ncbi:Predicted dithiol-disulfide isomerase, DsbA family [Palleronia salina]|uniref:Predicted dithiol-disulfide isomerase, DsbA family n=1 Tax=Palleronia salina TaxID=313368 RepID=A0A1M6AXQ5_9RHOB|nr:DsbA family oxidoreductase [Palleronia salina]SHI41274.1 Predicted dithiol-disulfide isomerase, DsbA family [Palleronia salina]